MPLVRYSVVVVSAMGATTGSGLPLGHSVEEPCSSTNPAMDLCRRRSCRWNHDGGSLDLHDFCGQCDWGFD